MITAARTAIGATSAQEFEKWDLDILAISLETSKTDAVDLWSHCCLLLALCEVEQRIAAVNLSFDLGLICGPKDYLPSPLGSYCYSFPLFEGTMDCFIEQRRRENDPPLIFASAGNRRTNETLWRLAYPAVLPDVVAVTQSQPTTSQDLLADWVDLPAVGPLNPCFAAPYDGITVHKGTSFSCVTLASKFTYIDVTENWRGEELGQFEKLARLLRLSSAHKIYEQIAPKPWIPP